MHARRVQAWPPTQPLPPGAPRTAAELIVRLSEPPRATPEDPVDRTELQRCLGLESEYLAARIFAQLDADGDGVVSRAELVRRIGTLTAGPARDRLRFVFGVHDEDGNGFIDRYELLRMLHIGLAENRLMFGDALVEDLVDALFEQADVNRDRRISFDELEAALARYPGVLEQLTLGDLRWLGIGPDAPPVLGDATRWRALQAWLRARWVWLAVMALYTAANVGLFVHAVLRYRELGANELVQIARGCGACLNLHGALVLLPMMRRALTVVGRTPLGRLLVDDHVSVHRVFGDVAFYLALVHTAAHLTNVALTPSTLLARLTSVAFVTGILLLGAHGLMWIFARDRIRRTGRFEWFALAHRLWPAWVALLLVHGPVAWKWMAVPVALYVVDRIARRKVRRAKVLAADVLASGVTRLTIQRAPGFAFEATDYVFVRLPAVSRSEWHPFTISSAPEREDAFTLHVRSGGNWTSRLHALAKERRPSDAPLTIDVDGPYGTPSARVAESKVAVLVGAGIGVTPFASLLSSLLERYRRGLPIALLRVHFVWVCREQRAFEWFADLLAELERAAPDRLCIHIYMNAGRSDLRSTVLRAAMDALYAKCRADLVTGLCARTTLGAPDWDALLGEIHAAHAPSAVDVFYCGPPGLAPRVREASERHGMHFRQEHF